MTDTIVMIHGMWGGGWYWGNYAKYFEEKGYRCITPTLPFHEMDPNDSPDPQLGNTSLLDYAEILEQGIDDLGEIPILMGHSMGGLLAQILASKGLAKALILLTPAPPSGIMALNLSVIRSFWSALTKWGFWKKPHRQTFNEAAYSLLNLMILKKQKETFEKFVYESGRAASEIGFWFFDPKRAANVDESKITCPVLVVAGAEDRITPASVVRKVADKYKAVSTYKEFPNHAHWVVEEPGWQEVAEYSFDWLNQALNKSA